MEPGGSEKAAGSHAAVTAQPEAAAGRRDFLSTVSTVVMVGGIAAGYGTFAVMAGRYVFPTEVETPWLFVAEANGIHPGDSLAFESPTGVKVVIARRAGDGPERLAEADDFIALSSVCPHLGCRVHWELNNQRFFCPCHNGVFDPEGKPVSGPPKSAEQGLPRFPLKVERGLLYIAMSIESVGGSGGRELHAEVRRKSSSPGRSVVQEDLA